MCFIISVVCVLLAMLGYKMGCDAVVESVQQKVMKNHIWHTVVIFAGNTVVLSIGLFLMKV